jgi:hypothetical protein
MSSLYIRRNYVPKFRGILFEDEGLKTTKSEKLGSRRNNHAPRAYVMHLGNGHKAICA